MPKQGQTTQIIISDTKCPGDPCCCNQKEKQGVNDCNKNPKYIVPPNKYPDIYEQGPNAPYPCRDQDGGPIGKQQCIKCSKDLQPPGYLNVPPGTESRFCGVWRDCRNNNTRRAEECRKNCKSGGGTATRR